MIDLLINIIKESINLWTAMSPYLLLGMFVAGILHAYLGPAFISRHLGGTGFASILKEQSGKQVVLCEDACLDFSSRLKFSFKKALHLVLHPYHISDPQANKRRTI